MSQNELFDIFDADRNWIGTATRKETHAKGLWHQTFQCWIVSVQQDEVFLLLQLRHKSKDTFPNLLDISCAGHLGAGERPEDGIRELEEELGLQVAYEDLVPCGIFQEDEYISPELMDREFCHVYLYQSNQPLDTYKVQLEEVSGLFLIKLDEMKKLFHDEIDAIPISGYLVDENDGRLQPMEKQVSKADLVPHPVEYYKMVIEAVERMVNG